MKFLFISRFASSLDLAYRVLMDGNKVKFFVDDDDELETGIGIVDRIGWKHKLNPKTGKMDDYEKIPKGYEPFVSWADVVIVDFVGYGSLSDDLRKRGKKVFGGSLFTDRMENERRLGMETAEGAGIAVPPHFEFSSLKDAVNFVKSNPDRYVLKPDGQQEKNLLFVGKDESGEDLIAYAEGYLKNNPNKIEKSEFTLEKFVDGVEVAVSAFCDGKHLMNTKNVNFEHKKQLAGNLGCSTGETGTTMFDRSNPQKLFDLTLNKIEKVLVRENYRGWLDVNLKVNEQGAWFIEWTSRLGYPQALILDEVMGDTWSKTFFDVASGAMADWKTTPEWHCGIVVFSEGFPFWQAYQRIGVDREVEGINAQTIKYVKMGELYRKNDKFLTTGCNGETVVVTATGKTAREASENAQARIKKINFPALGYRNDIGYKNDEDFQKLKSLGLLT